MENGNGKTKLHWDFTLNVGTMIHLGSVILAIFMVWHTIDKEQAIQREKQEQFNSALEQIQRRTERIENYLLRMDPAYMQRSAPPSFK